MRKKTILKTQITTTVRENNIQNIKNVVFAVIRETIELKGDRPADIKTAVHEALNNVVKHAYRKNQGKVVISTNIYEDETFDIKVKDFGLGIEDIHKAREPLFTTQKGASGMGFVFMEAFSENVIVESTPGKGTTVILEF